MASLASYRKAELKLLAEELGVDINPTDKIVEIIRKIESNPDYDKTIALDQIKVIREERLEESELAEKRRVEELAEKRRAEEFQAKQEADQRAYELERLRITQASETNSMTSNGSEQRPKNKSLKNLVPKFDPSTSDIALYLDLFQRQARKIKLEEENYVTELLALMPVEIGEIIVRMPESETEKFEQVKKVLLERFRLSAEAFRQKFMTHRRKGSQLWKDLIFDLEGYLNGWLESLEIKDFDSLKKLLISEQIKERASEEIKSHFIDTWTAMVDPSALACKIDEYEAVRRNNKFSGNKINEGMDRKRSNSFKKETESRAKDAYSGVNWRDKKDVERSERSRIFDQRRKPTCYECDSPLHLRYQCPKLKKVEQVNQLENSVKLHESFKPYLSVGKLNGQEISILRDTGSSIDVTGRDKIDTSQLNGENIWVKTPLTNEFKNLPLATVELEIEGVGRIITKTAVVGAQIKMDHYILGNQTQELIDKFKENPHQINEIVTRSRANCYFGW